MLAEWVLILWVQNGNAGGLTTVEFDSEVECRQSGEHLIRELMIEPVGFTKYSCIQRRAETEGKTAGSP